jgi:hypothetical protein
MRYPRPGSGCFVDEIPGAVPCRPIGDIDPEAHTRLMRDLSGEARAFAGDVRMAEAVCRNQSRQIKELKAALQDATRDRDAFQAQAGQAYEMAEEQSEECGRLNAVIFDAAELSRARYGLSEEECRELEGEM